MSNDDYDVTSIQEALTICGFNPGKIDGKLGPNTVAAIKAFQKEAGLSDKEAKNLPTRLLMLEDLKSYLETSVQVAPETKLAFNTTQLQVLNDFLAYKEQAGYLGEAMRAVNHDTAGLGKDLKSSELKLKQIEQAKQRGFVNGIDAILNDSIITPYNQHQFALDAYDQFYYTQTEEVKDNINYLVDQINPFGDENKNKLTSLITNDFINFIVQNYGYDNISELKDRLFNTDSIARKILDIKNGNTTTAEQAILKDNLFIKELYPILATTTKPLDNIKLYSKRFDTYTSNQLTEALREIEKADPLLYKDIMDVGIIQSGLNNSPITYMGLIPYEYYNNLVKEAFTKFNNKKNGVEDLIKFNQLFIRNNTRQSLIFKVANDLQLSQQPLGYAMFGKDYDLNNWRSDLPQIEVGDTTVTDYIPEEDNTIGDDEIISYPSIERNKTDIKPKDIGLNKKEISNQQVINVKKNVEQYNKKNGRSIFVNFKQMGQSDVYTWEIVDKANGQIKLFSVEETQSESTPKDNTYEKYITENLTTTDLLKKIIDNTLNDSNNELAKKLLEIQDKNKTVKVVVLPKFDSKVLADNNVRLAEGQTPDVVGGFWSPINNTIYLSKEIIDTKGEYSLQRIFLHELLHSYTAYPLTAKDKSKLNEKEVKFIDDITTLYNEAKKNAKTPTMYGYTNVAEFITEIMTQPSFVKEIKSLNPELSIWNKILNTIYEFLTGESLYEKPLYERSYNVIYDYLDNLDQVNPTRNLQREARASVEQKEDVSESPFKKQAVFFKRALAKLKKERDYFKKGTIEYNKAQEKIDALDAQLEEAIKNQSKEEFTELGSKTLNTVENDIIKRLETDNLSINARDIEYASDVIEAFKEFQGLKDKAGDLEQRLFPFINKNLETEVNEHTTKKGGVSLDEINKQNKDIGRWTAGTGALADSYNYIVNTIGSIIDRAKNKVEIANKQLKEDIQTEIDLLYNYSKKNGVKLENMYDVFIQNHKGTTKLTTEFDENGDVNPNFEKIQNTPELLRFYDFYKERIYDFQRFLPSKYGSHYIPNIGKRSVVKVLKNLIPAKYSKDGQLILNEELENDMVPTEYTKKLSPEDKSTDLGDMLLQFGRYANNHSEMTDILPKVRLLQRALKQKLNKEGNIVTREFIKSSDPTKSVNGENSNLYKMTEDIIKMQVLGQMKKNEGKMLTSDVLDEEGNKIGTKHYLFSDLADVALKYNSLLKIGFSPITAVTNVTFGEISNIIEAVGGQFFNVKDLKNASNVFVKQAFKQDSFLNTLIHDLNFLQELDDYSNIESTEIKGKLTPEKALEYAYILQKGGEKLLQARSALAIVIHEGYSTTDGKPTEKWNNITEKEKLQLADKIHAVNNMMHGRYSQKEAAAWQQNVIFRLASQFRKWIPAFVESRLGEKQFNNRLGVETEGRYITLKNFIFTKDVLNNIVKLSKGELSPMEQYNMKKNLIEITIWAATTLLYAMLHGGDDDEAKKRRKLASVKLGLTILNRVSGDLQFFYSPKSLTDIAGKAIPISTTAATLLQGISYIPSAFGEEAYYKSGSRKGKHKALTAAERLIPGGNVLDQLSRIGNEQQLEELN